MSLIGGRGTSRSLVFAAISLLLVACGRTSGGGKAPHFENAPVILISIDTLRADHLPAYGYRNVETPAIDALRRDAILYENAYSHVPLTLPSHVSILTGLLPAEDGVRDNVGYPFDAARHVTIPSFLKGHGYATGAAVSAYVLRGTTGIAAAFDDYDDAIEVQPRMAIGSLYRPGYESAAIAGKWIDSHSGRPYFYMLHLFEPHTPYEPPEPFKSRFANPYDGEIATADDIVGKFIATLKQKGLYDKAIIILLSDHGEGLMDHGEDEHGILLNREAIHVPLLVKLPANREGGRSVAAPVQLTDVFPTVAQLLGFDAPQGLRGASLMTFLDGKTPADRRIFSETLYPRIHLGWSDLRSLIDAQHHYIESPHPELYDVAKDPAEKSNVITDRRRAYASLRKELDAYPRDLSTPQNVDPEEAKKLAALGYISATKPAMEGDLPDPKEHILEIQDVKAAYKMAAERDYAGAVARLKEVLDRNPGWSDAWNKLAVTYEDMGDYEKAAETYKKAITLAPTVAPEFALSLAVVLEKLGRYDEAAANAELAMKSNPGGAHQQLGHIALSRGQLDRATNEARAAMADPTHRVGSALLLAEIDVAAGRLDSALRTLDEIKRANAARNEPPVQSLEFMRGDIFARMNRATEAEQAFLEEIHWYPHNQQAYANLALIYMLEKRPADAQRTLEQMAQANPGRNTYLFAAKTLEALGDRPGASRWRRRADATGQVR